MTLKSQLFSGDSKLEAAALSDPAHIVPGAAGSHVGKIQRALIELDGAAIVQDGLYSAVTANAVLAYKQGRNIVNRSYQTKADNIVGKMTIASLDLEMFEKENKANRKKTGFIYCQSFPFPRLVSTHGATGSAPTASMSPSQEARAHQRDALNWVEAAHEAIGTVLFLKLTGKESNIKKLKTMQEQIALNTHFKLNKHPNPFSFLNELARTYNQIRVALARADSLFVDDLTNKVAFAYAYPGGMYSQIFDHKKIYFCSSYLGKGPLLQTAVIVHEIAHYVDRDILHFASELPPPKGSPVDSSKNYIQLTPHEAARNAYTYAQFALHTFLKRDKRIVPFNE